MVVFWCLGVNSTESVYSSSLSSPDALISISAILPAIYSLKLLLVDETSDVCSTNVLLSNLLEYIQRLSYVSVRALEPLLTLSAGKVLLGYYSYLKYDYSTKIHRPQ